MVSVNPMLVRIGNPLTLSGTGFPTRLPVALIAGTQTYDLGMRTSADGSFSVSGFILPGIHPGTVTIRVVAGNVISPPVQLQIAP
jgi:hypothetical protein